MSNNEGNFKLFAISYLGPMLPQVGGKWQLIYPNEAHYVECRPAECRN